MQIPRDLLWFVYHWLWNVTQKLEWPIKDLEIKNTLHAGVTSTSRPRVCIVGGGFGGLYTAVRLQSLLWPQGKTPQVLNSTHSLRHDRHRYPTLCFHNMKQVGRNWLLICCACPQKSFVWQAVCPNSFCITKIKYLFEHGCRWPNLPKAFSHDLRMLFHEWRSRL